MDLNLGGIVREVVTPALDTVRQTVSTVTDTVALVRTGTTDQIASFLRANPEQRGVVETALATSGRAGDLSTIIDRAGSLVTNVVTGTAATATQAVAQADAVVQQVLAPAARPAETLGAVIRPALATTDQVVSRTAGAVSDTARAGVDLAGRIATATTTVAGRPVSSAGEAAALADRFSAPAATVAGRTIGSAAESAAQPIVNQRAGGVADPTVASRGGEAIATALREGRLLELILSATKEGRLAELLTDARASGRLADLALAARSLDGALAAFAARGGLSVTELALLARSGLFSEADAQALRNVGLPIGAEHDDLMATLAPRDGPGELRSEAESADLTNVAGAELANTVLASFDAGAIRIGSRAAFESYGLLGPPGSTVIAADAFEGLVREAEGDLLTVEQRLGLEAGVLADPDTFVALIDRGDLSGLRLAGDVASAAGWLPGGDRAGGPPSALADLARPISFREVTIGEGGGWPS